MRSASTTSGRVASIRRAGGNRISLTGDLHVVLTVEHGSQSYANGFVAVEENTRMVILSPFLHESTPQHLRTATGRSTHPLKNLPEVTPFRDEGHTKEMALVPVANSGTGAGLVGRKNARFVSSRSNTVLSVGRSASLVATGSIRSPQTMTLEPCETATEGGTRWPGLYSPIGERR